MIDYKIIIFFTVLLIVFVFICLPKKLLYVPYNSTTIAKYILTMCRERNIFINLSMLEKAVYIANGMHLSSYGKPLVRQKIIVGEFGPEIEPLFDLYKKFGNSNINVYYDDEIKYKGDSKECLEFIVDILAKIKPEQLFNWVSLDESPYKQSKSMWLNIYPIS